MGSADRDEGIRGDAQEVEPGWPHGKAGESLSLPYHRQQDETIMPISGSLHLEHFVDGEAPTSTELAMHEPFHIRAGLPHRMVAVEDRYVRLALAPKSPPS